MFNRLLRQSRFFFETRVSSEHAVLRVGKLQEKVGSLPTLFCLSVK
jgi:hypothetical protein